MRNQENRPVAIQVSGVKKMYRLGQIGGGTLQADLQSWWARVRGKEDPNTKIGEDQRSNGQTFMALNGIDLTIYQGEAVGIIGSNGAGKSTLLKLLSKVTSPTEGEIDIFGRIASMLEVGTGFNGELTGRENVYMNGAILGMTKQEIDAKMEEIIEFSEVREFIDTPVKRYSSGMFVKLAFSVAAHLDSEIMIMDEVLAVGDVAFQKKCLEKMKYVANKEGRTVLYVSHNMNTIRKLCDRCIVLDKGRVVYQGDVESAISAYLGAATVLSNQYVYTDEFHNNPSCDERFRLTSGLILNKEIPVFNRDETVDFQFQCFTKSDFHDIGIRFEVITINGTIVGTYLPDKIFQFKKNETSTFRVKLDLENLAPGKYEFVITVYQFDQMGNEQYIDGVDPGFYLEISEIINESNPLVWLNHCWGYTRFNDARIQKTNSSVQ